MKSSDSNTIAETHEMRSDEFDELGDLMVLAFKNSIEEDRIDVHELQKLMKKLQTPAYKVLQRVLGIRTEFYVSEVENTIASGIQLDIRKDEVYVSNIMTHPNYRHQGLARALLHLSFRRARELNKKKVRLDARADNTNAVSLYSSEGFETTYHTGRFELDSIGIIDNTSNELIIREVNKTKTSDIDPMLNDCFPAQHLEAIGRAKFLKRYIPSRALRFFARKLGGQLIHTYVFCKAGEKRDRGIIQTSQSKFEPQISISSPILFERDNDFLLEVIPKILKIESSYQGITTATITCSMHRTDTISKIERLGFRKVREGVSMTIRL